LEHGHFGIIGTNVFEGLTPSVAGAIGSAKEERRMWTLAGARGLSFITATTPGD